MKQKFITYQIFFILICLFLSHNIHSQKVAIDTLLNSKKYLVLGPKNALIKIAKSLDKYPDFNVLTQYKDDYVLIKNKSSEDFRVFRKYNPSKSFKDYPALIYKGKLVAPDFNSDPDAKRFITRIKQACKEGVNFGGHYTLVSWGCGTACQSNVLVDRKTGKIYNGFITSLGVDYTKASNLIIKNTGAIDFKSNLIEVCLYCNVSLEVWDGKKFIPIH